MITKILKFISSLLEYVLVSVLIFFIIYIFVAQLVQVSGNSMVPTFHDKEQLLAEKLSIATNNIKKGDIIIFNSKNISNENVHLLIKRVIATSGDKIKFENGFVYLNDELLTENYLTENTITFIKPEDMIIEGEEYIVGEDSYFVLGDNRTESKDSRSFGSLHKSDIIGKVIARYYPFETYKMFK